MQNKQLAEELHKATIRKFEKRKVQYFFFYCVLLIFIGNMHGLFL